MDDRSNLTDAELARQCQAGSARAFEELVHRYEHRVYAFVWQFCRHATDAAEITQDTFVKASQSIGQFDTHREFAPWLLTIARRKWIDRQRTARPAIEEATPELTDENHPHELLAQQEDRKQLWAIARKCLSDHQYQALWLRYIEDLEIVEIARVLGKTRIHVKVLLFRARQILGTHLQRGAALAHAVNAQPSRVKREPGPRESSSAEQILKAPSRLADAKTL